MNEKFLKEKKSQKILLSVMAALILILAVCAISTADTAIPENALTQCEPERIQDLDNGVQQIYFNIDQKTTGIHWCFLLCISMWMCLQTENGYTV